MYIIRYRSGVMYYSMSFRAYSKVNYWPLSLNAFFRKPYFVEVRFTYTTCWRNQHYNYAIIIAKINEYNIKHPCKFKIYISTLF